MIIPISQYDNPKHDHPDLHESYPFVINIYIYIHLYNVYKSWNETWCMPEKVDIPTCGLYSFHQKAMWKIWPGTASFLSSHVGLWRMSQFSQNSLKFEKTETAKTSAFTKFFEFWYFRNWHYHQLAFFGEDAVKMAHKKTEWFFLK